MSAWGGAADTSKKNTRTRVLQIFCSAWVLCLGACSGAFDADPLVEFSTELVITGGGPHALSRRLDAGVYVVEVRERDIDLRVRIDAGTTHTELADAFQRHGLYRAVVRLAAPADLLLTLESVDMRSWKGAAALRILRWPEAAADAAPDRQLLGYEDLGKAGALIARDTAAGWRASLAPLRDAAWHFQAANDIQALAEAEYQRGQVELNLLSDPAASRHSAESAFQHFREAGDVVGLQRARVLVALAEFGVAGRVDPGSSRAARRALLEDAARRVRDAQDFFETRDMQTDALVALGLPSIRDGQPGSRDDGAAVFEAIRRRARARGDAYFELSATRSLGDLALRKGDVVRAAALYESVLPLAERDRNPGLYAAALGDLGQALIALGEFDRALLAHAEALAVFSARGETSRAAQELTALAAIHFRSGNAERALATIESALPLYEHSNDLEGHLGALRLAGNAAAEIGMHERALAYLRSAEHRDTNAVTLARTRVLIAGELRTAGELRAAELTLAQVMPTKDASTRADALLERARLRQQQHRESEALADLREADATYALLRLDFNRIASSAALSRALLDAGDLTGASEAADIAVAMERRIRIKAANPEMRARFLAASHAPYEARLEVDLATGERTEAQWRAFRTAEAIRARSLTDRLAHADGAEPPALDADADQLRAALRALQLELEHHTSSSRLDPALLELRRRIDTSQAQLDARLIIRDGVRSSNDFGLPESRAEVQAALPADTAVLAYFVGDRHSHAWLLTRGGLRHSLLPGRATLEHAVAAFVAQTRRGMQADAAIAPLLGDLLDGVNAKRLVVLPDGPLNGLPFAALPLPHGGPHELLVDRFVLSSAPSLALALRPVQRHAAATRVAVVFDPVYTREDRRMAAAAVAASRFRGVEPAAERLARLPYSAIEARAVMRAFAGTEVIQLAGFDATARRVTGLPSRDLEVLHFATHAVVRRDAPGQSALFLSEYGADGAPLTPDRLTVDDITLSGLRADVVVLSGCSTGDGRELRGEGVLGLTYGFMANGSNAVIASLWPVEDALTARFMEEFYAAYRATGHAADALRLAQLRTRDDAGSPVWSSFVLRASALR